MQKLIKSQLYKQYLRKIEYKSIITRLLEKKEQKEIQKENPFNPQNKEKNIFLQLLDETDPDEKPKDLTEYDPRDRLTLSVKEDTQVFLEVNKEISDLERQRMQNIDKVLGTKTHFHETLPYEERLDSDHVMERKIVKHQLKKSQLQNPLERMLNIDPQSKIPVQNIRNFSQFSKDLLEQRFLAKHDKYQSVFKNKYDQFIDYYNYLKIQQSQGLSDDQQKVETFENEMNQQRIDKFVQLENNYTEMSLFKVGLMEEQMAQELRSRNKNVNIIPYYTDKYLYFLQDQNNVLNVQRIQMGKYTNEPLKIQDLQKDQIQQIVTKLEIINFLENYVEFDKRIEQLLDDIELKTVYYQNIIFNKKHDKIAFVFDVYQNSEEYICIIKDLTNQQFIPRIFTNIHYQMDFDDFENIYFVQKNDLKRYSKLSFVDLSNKNITQIPPINILEEKNPNYQLQRKAKKQQINFINIQTKKKVKRNLNKDIILLESSTISGSDQNQLYFKESYIQDSQFRLLLERQQNTKTVLKMGEQHFFYTQAQKEEYPTKLYRSKYVKGSREQIKNLEHIKQQNLNIEEVYKQALQVKDSELTQIALKEQNQSIEIVEQQLFLEVDQTKEEYIKHFEVFQHYIVAIISQINQEKEYFKIFNFKNNQFHTFNLQEKLYDIQIENNQFYQSSKYFFTISTPQKPNDFVAYDMENRQIQSFYETIYDKFQKEDYILENLEATSRDGKQIPFTLVYNKQYVNANSPCILYLTGEIDKRTKYELNPVNLSAFDRGAIFVYPHMRGTFDINKQWFLEGAQIKKLTNFCDLIDIAKFIRDNDISKKICGYSKTPVSGLTLFHAILNEPNLIQCAVIQNGLFDVLEYLQSNYNKKTINMFGDIEEDKDLYDLVKDFSPYQANWNNFELENILFVCENQHQLSYQTRKMFAKLRENQYNREIYFREYLNSEQNVIDIQNLSFIINTAFYKMQNQIENRKQ